MKKILISALFATSCLSAPALAQTTTDTSTTTAPAATETTIAPATTTTTGTTTVPAAGTAAETQTMAAGAGTQNEGGFITYQEGNQVLGSGLMGARIRGADGENIGSVDDLLLDRDGQVLAVVVGVGGFLGIGQKNVAIANDQLQFVLVQEAAAANQAAADQAGGAAGTAAAPAGTAATTGGVAATVDPAAPVGTAPVTGAAPAAGTATPVAGATDTTMAPAGGTAAGTGMMASDGTAMPGVNPGAANRGFGWTGAGIDHIQVNFTRQQLEDAPAFETAE